MRLARGIAFFFLCIATALGCASAWHAWHGRYDVASWCAAIGVALRFESFAFDQAARDMRMEMAMLNSLKMIRVLCDALTKGK